MNNRIVKIFLALLAVMFVLSMIMAAVNYLYRARTVPSQREDSAAAAQKALEQSRAMVAARAESLPSYRAALSTKTAAAAPGSAQGKPRGGMMVVRNRNFDGVVEPPKGIFSALNGLAGEDEGKPSPVSLKEADLDKKISIAPPDRTGPVSGAYKMPGLEDGGYAPMGALNMIKAPVDFEVFKTSESWSAFASSHKWHCTAECGQNRARNLSDVDFSRESVIVLVSMSDLPHGIFKVAAVAAAQGNIVVRYRVDPLALSAASKTREAYFYAAAVIPGSGLPVRLEQVP